MYKHDENELTPLNVAILQNHLELAKILVQNGADVNIVNNDGETPLHKASKRGNIQLVEILLQNGANINAKDNRDITPLYVAILYDHSELAKILVQNGADVNIVNNDGETPLNLATQMIKIDIQFVEILLKNGANVNIVNDYGRAPLHMATERGDIQLVEILLQNGADVNIRGQHRNTPLNLATQRTEIDIQLVEILLKNRANVNIVNNDGETPLHKATERGDIQLVEILLQNGADVNIVNNNGKTPFTYAIIRKKIQFVEIFSQNGADINFLYQEEAPLHIATRQTYKKYEDIQLVEILLQNGANVNILNKKGLTAIDIATEMGNIQLVEIFLQNGAKLNGQDKLRKTLLLAAQKNNIQLVEILLKHSANVSQPVKAYEGRIDDNSTTVLHFAAENGNLEMVKLLMTNGFDAINAKDNSGETPLEWAIYSSHLDVIKHLIENGAKIRRKPVLEEALHFGNLEVWKYLLKCNSTIVAETCSCESDLHSAVRAGQVEIVEEIINKEASKVKSDLRSCGCAVYIAVENGNEEILKILLTAGFSIESFLGLNPLYVAATFEHTRLVDILLKFGANINYSKTDKQKITPLDFAAAAGHANMVKFLLDFGADPMESGSSLTSLHYALNRCSRYDNETSVTPLMFQNLLKITEIFLIAGVNKIKKCDYETLIVNASKLTVSSDDKNDKKGEFRPEIIRCLLNYSREIEFNCMLDHYYSPIFQNIRQKIACTIIEYCDCRKISLSYYSFWTNIHVIDEIEDINCLLNFKSNYTEYINILKIIVARLELLPCDQQAEQKVNFYNQHSENLDWRNECQQQIINMKNTKIIDESNVTFYDILMKSVDKVAINIRNEKFLNSLELSIEKFPNYAHFFEKRVWHSKQRNELIDMCVNGMFHLIERNYKIKFSSEDIEEILQYLSVIELRRLSMACSSLFS
ncbi:ankyrin-3-like [Leptopilina boulardi]|uniref:ankyrin-3-like n=1 Tax=Leptopilina boulardi TaxID=63433 RepID=UPI0021F59A72|nr:ankyrin-3-like [Leptopilina boulardi]XP_051170464.1 ankyrin-3-like [Leptopilina boulardi]